MNPLGLALLVCLSIPAGAQDSSLWEARITELEGEVVIFPKGASGGIDAVVDMPLEAGDRIETGSKGRVEMALEAESVLELGADSAFEIESLSFKDSIFSLELGWIVAKIESLVSRRGQFRVRTPVAVAAVRGTEFAVEVDPEGHTDVGVFDEGKVALSSLAHPKDGEKVLGPLDEARLQKGRRRFMLGRLKRLKARHKRLKHLRGRRAQLKKNWKRLDPKTRAQLRRNWKARYEKNLQKLSPVQRKKLIERLDRGKRERLRRALKEKFKKKSLRKKLKKKFKKKQQKRGAPRRGRRR